MTRAKRLDPARLQRTICHPTSTTNSVGTDHATCARASFLGADQGIHGLSTCLNCHLAVHSTFGQNVVSGLMAHRLRLQGPERVPHFAQTFNPWSDHRIAQTDPYGSNEDESRDHA